MKKKYILSAILLAGILSASCEKVLKPQDDGRAESLESIYAHYSRLKTNINLVFYDNIFSGQATGLAAGGFMMSGYCDEAQSSLQTGCVYDWYDGRASSAKMPLAYSSSNYGGSLKWDIMYEAIDLCNTGIYYLEKEDLVTNYDEAYRANVLAQFYASRAMAYLTLIPRWGGVPVLTDPYSPDHDYSKDKRASFAAVVDQIIRDCDHVKVADPTLPWFPQAQNTIPTINHCALAGFKSRAVLYAASPLWQDDYEGTEKYTWERAARITKECLDSVLVAKASLVNEETKFPNTSDSGIGPYGKYFLSPYPWSAGWDRETIYQPYYYGNRQATFWKYNGIPVDAGQVYAGCCPTQEMVDAYEVMSSDGTQSAPLLNLRNPYNADGTPNFNQAALDLGYKDCSEGMYLNRDPRFYDSIYYDGCTVTRNGEDYRIETFVGGNCGISLAPDAYRHTCTGYYMRKFINADSGVDNGNKDGYMRFYRLSELYLNFAEAAYMAYGPDTAVEGMTAREALNIVRKRVGLPPVTENGEDFLLRLKNERRVELAFEEHRFFDVRRWQKPDGDLKATDAVVHGMEITVDDSGKKTYRRFAFERNCWDNKYLKYPLDMAEAQKMASLTGENWQNPGWE